MPFISILQGTLRVGGIDVLCESLENQPYKDFELILVDGIYKYRKPFIEEKLKKYSFPIKYAEPISNPFPVDAIGRFRNTELLMASGEIALFSSDYTFYDKNLLTTHAKFHKEHPRNFGLTSPHLFKSFPKIHKDFRPYKLDVDMGKNEMVQYCKDLESGKLNNVMWSLYEKPIDKDYVIPVEPDPWPGNNFDPKFRIAEGPINPTFVWTVNDSVSLKAALEVGGLDEYLDSAHSWNDTEFAERLTVKGGITWYNKPSNIAYMLNPRSLFPHSIRFRGHLTNGEVFEMKRSRGYIDPSKSIIFDYKALKSFKF